MCTPRVELMCVLQELLRVCQCWAAILTLLNVLINNERLQRFDSISSDQCRFLFQSIQVCSCASVGSQKGSISSEMQWWHDYLRTYSLCILNITLCTCQYFIEDFWAWPADRAARLFSIQAPRHLIPKWRTVCVY